MGRAYGTYGAQERCIQDFGRRPEEGLGGDGKIILKGSSRSGMGRRGLGCCGLW